MLWSLLVYKKAVLFVQVSQSDIPYAPGRRTTSLEARILNIVHLRQYA